MKHLRNNSKTVLIIATCLIAVLLATSSMAQEYKPIPKGITTPDKVNAQQIGTLKFQDGYPTPETAAKLADELDYLHGVEAFMNSIQGVSLWAFRKGYAEVGVKDNEFVIWSELMDANSLLLTANADVVYFVGFLDLSNGPLVYEAPPKALGVIDDLWFRWIVDFGFSGPDRGEGGKFLLMGPDYDGIIPEGGYFVHRSRTNIVAVLGRSFLENDDPGPAVNLIKETLKVYPYLPGGFGTSIGSYLSGEAPLARPGTSLSPRFVEGTGLVMNTIPPNDFDHYVLLNEVVQAEPAEALDAEIAGQFAAIGIVKGEKFDPDPRMRKILEEAVAVGNAASRTLGMGAHPADTYRYYDESSAWWNMLFEGGYLFLNPPPNILENGEVEQFPNKGARQLHSRTSMFYTATGITPAMIMRLKNVGSQYLIANVDANGKPFDGAKTYKVVLPPDIPAIKFWSITVYDNQSRSMLQTPQRYPRAGSQNYPSPAAKPDADDSTTIYFAPEKPEGVERGNWIQTDPEKGWFQILRLYFPKASFIDKTWRISDVEEVK